MRRLRACASRLVGRRGGRAAVDTRCTTYPQRDSTTRPRKTRNGRIPRTRRVRANATPRDAERTLRRAFRDRATGARVASLSVSVYDHHMAKQKRIAARVTDDFVKMFVAECTRQGANPSNVVRELLEAFLLSQGHQPSEWATAEEKLARRALRLPMPPWAGTDRATLSTPAPSSDGLTPRERDAAASAGLDAAAKRRFAKARAKRAQR